MKAFLCSTKPKNEDIYGSDWLIHFILIPLNKLETFLGKKIIEDLYGKKNVLPTKLKVILHVAILTKLLNVVTAYGQDPELDSSFAHKNKKLLALLETKKVPCTTIMETMLHLLPFYITERLDKVSPDVIRKLCPNKVPTSHFNRVAALAWTTILIFFAKLIVSSFGRTLRWGAFFTGAELFVLGSQLLEMKN